MSLLQPRWDFYFVSVDELLEYDVCGDDPNDGDQETPPDGHVCDVPSPEHDASQGLARERLWQAVRYVPDERENFFFVISTEGGALSLYDSTDRSAVGMDSTGHMMPLRIMFG